MISPGRPGPLVRRRQAIAGAAVGMLLPGVRASLAQAGRAQPSRVPLLLPDTTGHLGAVRAVAVTADGAMIATGSVDRSVRLWNGETRRLLRAWRPPLGDGEVGVIDALGFSADGKWLFVSAVDWVTPKGIVYVVNAETGLIRRVIASGTARTNRYPRVAASANGSDVVLASEHQGTVVMRIGADLATSVVFNDRLNRYDPTVAVAVSGDGATIGSVSQKGELRLFATGARTVEQPPPLRRPLPGEPISLCFSADGRRIAVGFANQRGVAVIDRQGGQISMLEPPAALGPGNVGVVAWAFGDDGAEWLFGGGTIQQPGGGNLVFAWRDGRPGAPLSVEVAQDSLADMAAHPRRGVVFGSSDGGWGRVTTVRGGRRLDVVLTPSERLDFREATRRRWSIDRSGAVIEFQGLQRGQPPLRFDLTTLRLDEFGARVPRPDLRQARAASAERIPADVLRRGEHVRSSDDSPRLDRVLVGTDEAILLFDTAGQEIGRRPVATPAWASLISGDGRVAVAAHGDGTIRWYGLTPDAPLHELGGLFVHLDRRRWVVWRNDGHFAYSELGGETLVGLHENGRYDATDPTALTSRWSSIDQRYRTLYDPEGLSALLRAGPHWRDAREPSTVPLTADPAPFPNLRVVQVCAAADESGPKRRTRAAELLAAIPETGPLPGGECQAVSAISGTGGSAQMPGAATAVRVRLDLGAARDPVVLDAFVNGINVGRSLHPPGSTVEKLVPLPPRDAKIEFRAYGPTGAFTRTPPLVVTRREQAPAAAGAKSTLHVLAIGIDRYAGTVPALRYAVSDAMTLTRTLERVAPDAYSSMAPPILLPNEDATLEAAQNAMLALAERAGPDDAVVIYLAGHGVSTEGEYAFVTANVRDASAREGCLRAEALVGLLSNIRASRSLLMLDTCFANALDLQLGGRLGHDSGRYVLAASGYDQQALDGYDEVNGVFGHALKEAMTEVVPASNGVLDALELCRYVRDRVEGLARERGHGQRAHFQAAGDLLPFPLAQSR